MGYYNDKLEVLRDLFGAKEVRAENERVVIDGTVYPVLDDVIVLLNPAQWPRGVQARLEGIESEFPLSVSEEFAPDIQTTFGAEWQKFSKLLPDYDDVFRRYFDIVPDKLMDGTRVFDLGCGTGRWSTFLKDRARELVMVDFSEAIFVARENLRESHNALFFLGDIARLPFRAGSADLVVCVGVLHHLPVDALEVSRSLCKFAPALLIYLYYSFDNRPVFYRGMFAVADVLRRVVCRVHNNAARTALSWAGAVVLYLPLVLLGHLLRPLGLSRHVPLYQGYRDKSLGLMRQDFYDRFFTGIEQRFSRSEILALTDTYARVTVSDSIPYWHFLCENSK